MSTELMIAIVFGPLGLLLFVIGVFLFIRTRTFVSSSQEVKGTVIRMLSTSGSEGGTVYAPVFKFTTINGQVIEVEEKVYSSPPGFSVGEVVDILYDPQNPGKARAKKWFSLYFTPLLLTGMGAIFAGIGLVLLVVKVIGLFTKS
jgi:hypothetical protein